MDTNHTSDALGCHFLHVQQRFTRRGRKISVSEAHRFRSTQIQPDAAQIRSVSPHFAGCLDRDRVADSIRCLYCFVFAQDRTEFDDGDPVTLEQRRRFHI